MQDDMGTETEAELALVDAAAIEAFEELDCDFLSTWYAGSILLYSVSEDIDACLVQHGVPQSIIEVTDFPEVTKYVLTLQQAKELRDGLKDESPYVSEILTKMLEERLKELN